MKRLLLVGLGCLGVVGCSKAPDAGDAATGASNLAFQYSYTFRLPSARIAAAQDSDAQRCERLGAARCRITGMTFDVDGSGEANASLSVALAAPLARRFGREGVSGIEQAGGTLVGAEITGTDTTMGASAADAGRDRARAEVQRIDAQLARSDLPGAERAELTRQRALAVEQAQAGAETGVEARASAATTRVSFTYRAGRGVGAAAELAEAGQTAYASLLTSFSILLTALAVLGPPALLLLALFVLWRRFGRPLWARLLPA